MATQTDIMKFYRWNATDQVELTVGEQTANWENLEARLIAQGGYNIKDFGALGAYKLGSDNKPLIGDSANALMNDTPTIQSALDRCRDEGGGIVYFPKGNYPLQSVLRIYSNTTVILHPQARVYRNYGMIGAFFCNGDSGASYTGYNGHGNIKFYGGYLDGNIGNFDARFNFFSVGHGHDITISNVYMKDCQTYHAIEMNSTQKGIIENCVFDGYTLDSETQVTTPDRRSEAVQFDGMYSIEVYGRFGAYDKTTCDDVMVTGCTFRNWNRGVGSHTSETGYHHRNVRVINNHFEAIEDIAVVTCMWENAVINNNTFDDCGGGVWVRVKDSTNPTFGYTVSGNTFRNIERGTSARHAVRVSGISGTDKNVRTITISNNTVEGTADSGFYIEGAWRVNVTGNVLNDCGGHGISLLNCGFGNITGNTVVTTATVGIRLEETPLIAITGNSISNCGTYGIHLTSNSYSCTIVANVTRNVSTTTALGANGIYVTSGSNNCTITSNTNYGSTSQVDYGAYVTSGCATCIVTSNNGGGCGVYNGSTSGVTASNIN